MHLTLLKADDYFVAWVDGAHVQVSMTVDELFGRLSKELEPAKQNGEIITGGFQTSYGGKKYFTPTFEDEERTRIQLSCFGGALIRTTVSPAPK
ncbi:MAG: hypothetical protein Q8P88_01070 [Candidatus Jorgensenbacteria bacterium]|nr:hypothetical protein [Candidatus Jorgensenbacteria bacterium]